LKKLSISKRNYAFLLACLILISTFASCKKTELGSSSENSNSEEIPYSQYNPLTGLEKDDTYPEGQRPVAIMINNIYDALPQRGISGADIIYEMVTEGGITRIMAVYTDYRTVPMTGPVRSARDQFIQLMMPLNAIYVHIGTSVYATEMLNYYSYQNIDGIYLGSTAFYFDTERAKSKDSEHCWYTNGELILSGMQQVNIDSSGTLRPVFNFVPPTDPLVIPEGGEARIVSFRFSGYIDAAFAYNEESGLYLKSEFNMPQVDDNVGIQLGFNNVFVLGTNVSFKPDDFCTDFDFSSGTGYYFTGGRYVAIRWEKGDPLAPLVLTNLDGTPLQVNCGTSYVAFINYTHLNEISITGAVVETPAADIIVEDAPATE
jgi:Protein of unknown function (DUF3048).